MICPHCNYATTDGACQNPVCRAVNPANYERWQTIGAERAAQLAELERLRAIRARYF